MKRISLILICMMMVVSWPAYSQFWMSVNWKNPHCEQCRWMEQALHLHGRRAADYHRIIHKYGKKIEHEARRSTRDWEASAKRIFALRMERDRALQLILNPDEFRLYVRYIREAPARIHDQGWSKHPQHRSKWRKEERKNHYKDQKHTNKKTDRNNERKRNDIWYSSRD